MQLSESIWAEVGSVPSESKRSKPEPLWNTCPIWPTDVFAFAATVIEKIGLLQVECDLGPYEELLSSVGEASHSWRESFNYPVVVRDAWGFIYAERKTKLEEIKENDKILVNLHFLLRCADETSVGLGWELPGTLIWSLFDLLVLDGLIERSLNPFREKLEKMGSGFLQWVNDWRPLNPKHSLCHRIPPERAVVIPKAIAAEVGYTIRSLSHHLALLDSQPKINVGWYLTEGSESDPGNHEHYNILFIPFPFRMSANCIAPATLPKAIGSGNKKFGYFNLNPNWLPAKSRAKDKIGSSAEIIYTDLILPLLESARAHCNLVDCIVFPECALTELVADALAKILVERQYSEGLRLFVAGAITEPTGNKRPQNKALSYFFDKGREIKHGHTKHHRWKLDVAQTRRYGFSAFPADSSTDWWEQIDVSERRLPFYAIRPHACMTVLVCEDLARNDPALPAVRAVGPNLVIALLMDGPQIPARWPARYATVLADDPGSAVLTVTSAAMVDRSNRQEPRSERCVALWKHHSGRTESLALPANHHGFLLSFGSSCVEQVTMDNRGDGFQTRRFELMGVEPLKLSDVKSWL